MKLREEIQKILKEELMSEISDGFAKAALEVGVSYNTKDANAIFGNKLRVVKDFEYVGDPFDEIRKEMESLGYDVDFAESKVRKSVQTKNGIKVREMSLDKAVKKEIDNAYKEYVSNGGKAVWADDFVKRFSDEELIEKVKGGMGNMVQIFSNEQDQATLAKMTKKKPGIKNFVKMVIKNIKPWSTTGEIEKRFGGNKAMADLGITVYSIKLFKKFLMDNFMFVEHPNGQLDSPKIVSAAKKYNEVGSGFKIVISRASIDVLRMSDWKHLQSCHSEPRPNATKEDLEGNYFHCAVQESKGGGLVAYLVQGKDLEGVDLQKEEIFSDSSRGISGITPQARMRLRGFEYETGDESTRTLVAPETASYGMELDAFYNSIKSWATKSQSEQLEFDEAGKVVGVKDAGEFHMLGGNYTDTNPMRIISNFVNKKYKVSGQIDISGMFDVIKELFATTEQVVEIKDENVLILSHKILIEGDWTAIFEEHKNYILNFPKQFRTSRKMEVDIENGIAIMIWEELVVGSNSSNEQILDDARSFMDFCESVETAAWDLEEYVENAMRVAERTTPAKQLFMKGWNKTNLMFSGADMGDEMRIRNVSMGKIPELAGFDRKMLKSMERYLSSDKLLELDVFSDVNYHDFTSIKVKITDDGEVILEEMFVAYPDEVGDVKPYLQALNQISSAASELKKLIGFKND